MAVDTGGGASFTFVTSAISLNVTSIQQSGASRASVETTQLSTTGGKTFVPGDTYDPGEIRLGFNFDPQLGDSLVTAIAAAAETMRITFALQTGQSVAAKVEGTGFLTGVDFNDSIAQDTLLTGSATIKYSGNLTYTDAT